MKKKPSKKMELSKETLRRLTVAELGKAGGASELFCESNEIHCVSGHPLSCDPHICI